MYQDELGIFTLVQTKILNIVSVMLQVCLDCLWMTMNGMTSIMCCMASVSCIAMHMSVHSILGAPCGFLLTIATDSILLSTYHTHSYSQATTYLQITNNDVLISNLDSSIQLLRIKSTLKFYLQSSTNEFTTTSSVYLCNPNKMTIPC